LWEGLGEFGFEQGRELGIEGDLEELLEGLEVEFAKVLEQGTVVWVGGLLLLVGLWEGGHGGESIRLLW
jgi:hypothetical protein